MLHNSDKLSGLFRKQANNTLTREEKMELALVIEIYPREILEEIMEIIENEKSDGSVADTRELWPRIAAIPSGARPLEEKTKEDSPWMMATAWVILISGVFMIYKWHGRSVDGNISHCDSIKVYMNGIPPGVDKAALTLYNGHQVLLDSAFGKFSMMQGGCVFQRLKTGEFQYTNAPGKASDTALYNTIKTSRGTQCIILLPDGSSARLNAESSIRFPLRFTSAAREVEIQGEVYFDVVKKPGNPFYVKAKTVRLEITGTSFNINAYNTEISATLVKGSLTIQHDGERSALKPGQEATILPSSSTAASTVEIGAADIEQTTSWKDGYIIFKNESMRNALQELARWYGLDLVNAGTLPIRPFSQVVCRDMRFEELVKMLRSKGLVFRVEGRRLVF